MTVDWRAISRDLIRTLDARDVTGRPYLDEGQRRSVGFIADQIPRHGIVLADEVGTGKTRIACFVLDAVIRAGGRVATVVPRGLMAQWKAEAALLRAPAHRPQELTTWLDFLSEGVGDDRRPPWWLLSHGFRFPSIRGQTPTWKFALPWLVLLAADPKRREDGRTRLNALWHQVNETQDRWRGQWAIAERLAKRLPAELLARIAALPLPDWDTATDDELARLFMRTPTRGEGLEVIDLLLRRWVGRIDLLVVDEAHKSRDADDEAPRTILSELLERSLHTDADSRRLCMTATPMELSMEQWRPLLHRARATTLDARVEAAMTAFRDSVSAAAIAPDEQPRIDALARAGQEFEATLCPFVTRRRRVTDPVIARFVAALPRAAGRPHPHRNIERVPVRWDVEVRDAGVAWRQVLIALEGMSRAARGLPDVDALKRLRTTLATGHALDVLDTKDLSEMLERAETPQEQRLKHWLERYNVARRDLRRQALQSAPTVGRQYDPDTEHPRIIAAVNAIEHFCVGDGAREMEKVLCFGVYLRPLRLLRDVLNVRHALRCVDEDEPAPASVAPHEAVAVRNYEQLRAAGRYRGALAGAVLSPPGLLRKLEGAHKRYARERARVGRRVDRDLDRELSALGVGRPDRRRLATLREALHTAAFESARRGGDPEVWRDVLRDAISGRDESAASDDESHDITRRLIEWIDGEAESERDGRVRSGYCRLLQGSSGWTTRRTLQASFRRPGSFPQILLAQSQVGREGLNLHEDCRVVVQLHAEWNPAVLEQQIGRVDRKGSRWEQLAEKWLAEGAKAEAAPRIEVRQIVFDGTYDASQWERVGRRQNLFDAALFGALLPIEAWARASEEQRRSLERSAPDFSPRPRGDGR